MSFQELQEETLGGTPIAPGLQKDIDHIAALVDGPPSILLPTLDVHEEFVQIPRVAHAAVPSPKRTRILRTEGPTPLPNRL